LASFFNARTARAAEATRFEQVRSLAHYMLFDLDDKLRGVPGNTAARAELVGKAQVYLDALAATRGASRDLRYETARGFIRLARLQDSPLDRNLGLADDAWKNIEKARTMLASLRADFGDAADIAIAEASLEAMAGLIAFYQENDVEGGWARFQEVRAVLESVPEADRSDEWRLAQRDVSRAEMEHRSVNEDIELLMVAADAHAAMVDAWPDSMKAGDLDEIEHAHAAYNHGLGLAETDREAEGYPEMRAAHDAFVAAEAHKPNDPDLLYMIGWTGADAYAAAARINLELEAEDLLVSASNAAKRLVAIEDQDESARVLSVSVGEAYAQHLGNIGRFPEAIAEQRAIIATKEARFAEYKTSAAQSRLAWSEMILGQIARQADDRALACEYWQKADANFTVVEKAGMMVAFYAAFLPGLRDHVARCKTSDPLSKFGELR
jgi:eukaryotic-like serine/threonine-protein kinase